MMVFVNGEFVPVERAVVSVFDRGFLYGDGLFETVRVCQSTPFRWAQHDGRLRRGAEFLGMRVPMEPEALRRAVDQLIARNAMPNALLRLTLSRGAGPRGYSPSGADTPTLVMALHPAPEPGTQPAPALRLATASLRLPADDPLAVFKSCNKLPQILARAEAEARGADEALLLNTRDEVAETAAGNLFWIQEGAVHTTPLAVGVLAGVTRAVTLELCAALGLATNETTMGIASLRAADGILVSNSSTGLAEVTELDGRAVSRSVITGKLQGAYASLMRRETTSRR